MDKQTRAARRAFKKHVAEFNEIAVNGNRMWILNWKAPDTNNMAVQYIFSNGSLQVTGDLGGAVYKWGNFVHLASIAGWGYGYILGKLTASSCKKYTYDPDKAAKDLTREFRENNWFKWDGFSRDEAKELLDEIISVYYNYNDPETAYAVALGKTDLEKISDLCECHMYDAGKTTHYWLLCQLVGLGMAFEQLVKRGVLPTPAPKEASCVNL